MIFAAHGPAAFFSHPDIQFATSVLNLDLYGVWMRGIALNHGYLVLKVSALDKSTTLTLTSLSAIIASPVLMRGRHALTRDAPNGPDLQSCRL
ncbi:MULTISPECIES: hypothetical protein [unclassified Bradyrhizobium]|uniref:hypothetical protein n=1 Tax=unclassified Bradyrhizobium TaxID=2631580 RepID=UPI002FEF8421